MLAPVILALATACDPLLPAVQALGEALHAADLRWGEPPVVAAYATVITAATHDCRRAFEAHDVPALEHALLDGDALLSDGADSARLATACLLRPSWLDTRLLERLRGEPMHVRNAWTCLSVLAGSTAPGARDLATEALNFNLELFAPRHASPQPDPTGELGRAPLAELAWEVARAPRYPGSHEGRVAFLSLLCTPERRAECDRMAAESTAFVAEQRARAAAQDAETLRVARDDQRPWVRMKWIASLAGLLVAALAWWLRERTAGRLLAGLGGVLLVAILLGALGWVLPGKETSQGALGAVGLLVRLVLAGFGGLVGAVVGGVLVRKVPATARRALALAGFAACVLLAHAWVDAARPDCTAWTSTGRVDVCD